MGEEPKRDHPALPDVTGGEVWFYVRDGAVHGPVGFKRLLELSARRELGPLVWQPHYPDWRPVESVPGLANVRVYGDLVSLPPLTSAERFPMLVLLAFSIGLAVMYGLGLAPVPQKELAAKASGTYELQVCHDGHKETAYVAIGYRQDGEWQSRGWYPVAPGECQMLVRGVEGPIFAFAETRRGGQTWTPDGPLRSFCIDARKAFALATTECEGLKSPYQLQAMGSLDLEAAAGQAVWRLRVEEGAP